MASSLQTVVSGLGAVACAGALASAVSIRARRDRPHLPGVHPTRDDSALDPIAAPLRTGCGSIEIGVRLDQAERLQVGGRGWDRDPGNTIGRLVLDRLAHRVVRLGGRVHRGQRSPMILMIEILEDEPARQARAYEVLDTELRAHAEMLTYISAGTSHQRAVTVVLTGARVPRHTLAAQTDRFAYADGNFGDVGAWGAPATLVPLLSEHWAWRFGWDGVEDMPVEERQLLREIVATAQADGRQVRFFGIPERPARVREAYWTELFAAGVDLVSTSDPKALARFLRRRGRKVMPRPATAPALGLDSPHGDGVLRVARAR